MCIKGFDRAIPGPKMHCVEDERVQQCREHIGRYDQHAEEDDFRHPFVIDLPASFDVAVPVIDVLREIERAVAGGTDRQKAHQYDGGEKSTNHCIHLISSFL